VQTFRRLPVWLVLFLTVSTVSTLVSCASYEAQPFKARAASSMINRFEKAGFVFAANLEDDDEYLAIHYGRNPKDFGLLPIEIFLENRSEGDNFEVRFDRTEYSLADGTKFEMVSVREVVETLSFSGWRSTPWWFFLIFPGAISLGGISEANDNLAKDYSEKVMEDLNVAPRAAPVHGVLFFRPVDKDIEDCDLDEGTLTLQVTRRVSEGQGETFSAQINF